MANRLRMVYENLANDSTIVASNAAISQDNLKSISKSEVWRSNSSSGALSVTFPTAQNVSIVSLPHSNLSSTATIRLRATNEVVATNLITSSASGPNLSWGNAPASVRYVTAPDGTYTAVVPKTNLISNRWQFDIPANTYPNGTVLTISWHEKIVPHTGISGQVIVPLSWVGATMGSVNSVAVANGFTRKWMTVTISDTSATQNIRLYLQGPVGADDLAAWGWQLELGSVVTSYYPNTATFVSRSSIGTYINVNGLVATAASGVARMQYHGPSGTTVAARLLVEAAATNLATFSQEFDNAVWPKSTAGAGSVPVVTSNYAVAPDGTTTADRVVFARTGTTSGDYSVIARYFTGKTNGDPYTSSIWVRSNTAVTQSVVLVGTTAGMVVEATPAWQRVSLSDVASGGAFGLVIGTFGGAGFTGGGQTNIDISIWQGQVETGSWPTSDIYTTTTTVTRNADVVTLSTGTRPLGYMDWWQSYSYDSGTITLGSENNKVAGLTLAQSASAYSYGGGKAATVYAPVTASQYFRIDISDPLNLQGYIEAANFVIGQYFSPRYDVEIGAEITMEDSSKSVRSEAGNLKTDVGSRYKVMNMDLSVVAPEDRKPIWKVVSYCGTSYPVFFSMYPENADKDLEQAYTVYGNFSKVTTISAKSANIFATQFEIEGI